MKQSILFISVIALILLALLVTGCGPKVVTFPDENLDTVIRDALGKLPDEEILSDELVVLKY